MVCVGNRETPLTERGLLMKKSLLGALLRKVHADEQGAVSIETVLIIAAIALPILIFLYTKIRPRLQNYLQQNMTDLGVPE